MKRDIIVGKDFRTYVKSPLIADDTMAYNIVWDLGAPYDDSEFLITAFREDGQTVTDSGTIDKSGKAEYTLANNMYCVEGQTEIRLSILTNTTTLTDKILIFDVLSPNNINAIEGNTDEQLINTLMAKFNDATNKLNSIPTKTSDLENDLKFVCEGDLYSETAKFVERGGNITELENNAGYAVWGDVMAVLADSLPKNTSQLTNDSGFTTWDAVMGFIHSSDFAYKSDIPSKASELENDCGYMIPLEGLEGFLYALKAVCNNSPAEIATKSYIDTQLGVIENGSY